MRSNHFWVEQLSVAPPLLQGSEKAEILEATCDVTRACPHALRSHLPLLLCCSHRGPWMVPRANPACPAPRTWTARPLELFWSLLSEGCNLKLYHQPQAGCFFWVCLWITTTVSSTPTFQVCSLSRPQENGSFMRGMRHGFCTCRDGTRHHAWPSTSVGGIHGSTTKGPGD